MRILHYNDEEKQLHRYLAERGQSNVILGADADVFAQVRRETFEAAFIGLHPHGLQLIRLLHRQNPDCLVTLITSDRNARMAVEAMKLGAFDYLLSPLDFAEVERAVIMMMREYENQRELRSLEGRMAHPPPDFPGHRRRRPDDPPLRGRLRDIVQEVEAQAIRQTLKHNQGNYSQAAKTLAISRTTLYTKMREYGIEIVR